MISVLFGLNFVVFSRLLLNHNQLLHVKTVHAVVAIVNVILVSSEFLLFIFLLHEAMLSYSIKKDHFII